FKRLLLIERADFSAVAFQPAHGRSNLAFEVGLAGDRHAADGIGFQMLESRPKGLHLRPLAERCVRFSPHTAPIRQTRRPCLDAQCTNSLGLLMAMAPIIWPACIFRPA